MTPRMAAIFRLETDEGVIGAPVTTTTTAPASRPVDSDDCAFEPWPIVLGSEHFSLWVDDADGDWPEFDPAVHYDVRQPSRLRGLLAP